jgi:hypothetical protein
MMNTRRVNCVCSEKRGGGLGTRCSYNHDGASSSEKSLGMMRKRLLKRLNRKWDEDKGQ